uniref:winged helix-turn-helix transcriptional regulator n=1 Tax=Herbidospora sakaeratensis TaxID=564415 RepID=UPI000784C98D|nr:helix-turn-helix domain-containing protein [Herbidospora sakaeratensis]
MLPRTYEGQVCSIARTLEVIGERWTLLIVRDALRGTRRFEDFRANLGIAHNILSDRLGKLREAGVLERRLYQTKPDRHEYHVTAAGLDLWPIVMSSLLWGDRHRAPEGPPLLVRHRGCGGSLRPGLTCDRCGRSLGPHDCDMEPGPGAQPAGASVSPARPA